jgi:hypothetical protein
MPQSRGHAARLAPLQVCRATSGACSGPGERHDPGDGGAFYSTALNTLLARINADLLRWIRKKYRRYRGYRRATQAWSRAVTHHPRLFAHCSQITQPLTIKMMGAG